MVVAVAFATPALALLEPGAVWPLADAVSSELAVSDFALNVWVSCEGYRY